MLLINSIESSWWTTSCYCCSTVSIRYQILRIKVTNPRSYRPISLHLGCRVAWIISLLHTELVILFGSWILHVILRHLFFHGKSWGRHLWEHQCLGAYSFNCLFLFKPSWWQIWIISSLSRVIIFHHSLMIQIFLVHQKLLLILLIINNLLIWKPIIRWLLL